MAIKSTTNDPVQGGWPPTDPDVREQLRDLPPSATLVALTLAADGPLTQDGIATESLLPARTVRYGLGALQEAGLLVARSSLEDARRNVYDLSY